MDLSKHGRIMLNGVAVLAPAAITGYVVVKTIVWLDAVVEAMAIYVLKWMLPESGEGVTHVFEWSFPGAGVVVGIGLIYLVGLLARSWLFGWVLGLAEGLVERIPLVKTLYAAVRDLLKFLSDTDPATRGRPAFVEFEGGRVRLLGLVTQEDASRLGVQEQGQVAVYLPMSYQIGGFTVMVPREAVRQIEGMRVEDLLKLAMTAGVGASRAPGKDGAGGESAPANAQQGGASGNP